MNRTIKTSNFKSGSIKQKAFAEDILNSTYEAATCDLRNLEAGDEMHIPKVARWADNKRAIIAGIEELSGKKFSAKSVIEASEPARAIYYQDKCWKIDFDAIK